MNTEFKKEIKAILVLPEQIEAKAREIGSSPYHPTDDYYHFGITVRQELMRTAMGAIITLEYSQRSGESMAAKSASMFTNALLLQMAKDELGVSNE